MAKLRSSPPEAMAEAVTQAMTVNETSFFRDGRAFDALRSHVVPELGERGTLRVWSAASSSGQEAWSIAIALQEAGARGWEIVGTDLSAEVVARAETALYSQFEVQRGLTIHRLVKHFVQEGAAWRTRPELRATARFRQHNLLEDAARLGRFDVVFLRNVMIYFDLATKRRVLDRIRSVLSPGGYLYLGGTETLLGVTSDFATVRSCPASIAAARRADRDASLPKRAPLGSGRRNGRRP